MGTYVSVPFASRKVVHVEPSKQVLQEYEDISKMDEQQILNQQNEVHEENVIEIKQEQEPVADIPSIVPIQDITIVDFPPKIVRQLSILIPEDDGTIKESSMNAPTAAMSALVLDPEPRIPEFTGNMNSVSHAVKKFNRRHRKK